jgi:hypothetical protein
MARPMCEWGPVNGFGFAGVEGQAGRLREDVLGVGMDSDPATGSGFSPVGELARDHDHIEEAGGVERVAGRATRAVVAVSGPTGVTAAQDVGLVAEAVGGFDDGLDRGWSVGRSDG